MQVITQVKTPEAHPTTVCYCRLCKVDTTHMLLYTKDGHPISVCLPCQIRADMYDQTRD